jgi:hypothetical protein
MTDPLSAWIRPPSERAAQRRARRRLRVAICIVGAFLFGLSAGWMARTPTRLTCYAPNSVTAIPAPLFVCRGEFK